ncbi:uncharacterized protein TNCV_5021051 [Trichonephila clavipes]|nr:uncharacterized protein TNCV_5021051 [Trichonephila clavipes]
MHISLFNESYEEAWGKWIDRYDKKKQIVYALIKTFLDQKGVSQVNMTNLRNLVDTSDEELRELKAFDEAHFWLNGYVNKQNCRIWSEANPQVYVVTPLHPEKLTVWCALWAGGILLQKR